MIRWMFFFVAGLSRLVAQEYSVVFIHIGDSVPQYSRYSIEQVLLFNPSTPVYFLLSAHGVKEVEQWRLSQNVILVNYEELEKSEEHELFIRQAKRTPLFQEKFWRYTTERFLYLDDFFQKNLHDNIFHMEYDNMLYVDLDQLLPVFNKYYDKKLAITLDFDSRAIAGFIYFSDSTALKRLARFLVKKSSCQMNDMQLLAHYFSLDQANVSTLPVLIKEYAQKFPLENSFGKKVRCKEPYLNHLDEFDSIFDAAAIGQYLGGIDPKNGPSHPGFVNETTCFNCEKLDFIWELDEEHRKIPKVSLGDKKYRINNLHIHSKRLECFVSK